MIPTDILNYRIVRHLGTGGMGSVYLAVNTDIDQQVAIKSLRPDMAKNAQLRARFKQEAELLCSLDHPNIVKFLNYVETPQGVFLIMEYVKGTTLEDFIKKKNGLIVEDKAYPLLCEILDAFSYAHKKGIVHRDIKPSNIIIQDDGHIKVMDFGIAQIISESNSEQSGMVMGTPTYMSPEQVYGKSVDARSDIYSLGVLIYHMLTARAPYDSTTLTAQEIKRKVVKEDMPRMSEIYPYISDAIQAVVDRATRKVPEARYQTCDDMKAAVRKALAPDPISKPLLYGGIAVLSVLLIGGFITWDYFRTKVKYYRDYVEVMGVPHGVGSLSSSEVSHREGSYRFEYSQYKLRRVSYVNSKGSLIPHTDSEAIDRIIDMTISYNEGSGNVDVEKFMNASGKVLYVKDFDNNFKTCTFKLDDEYGTEMTLNSQVSLFESKFDNTNITGKSKVSKYLLQYDDRGYLVKVEYAGFGNMRVPDGQGIFGRSYVYDDKGRVLEEHYLGKDGKPKATQFGLGVKKFRYDEDDNMSHIEYQTIDGKPSSDGNNCPVVEISYDEWGNRVSEKYYDTKGNLMVRKDISCAGFVYDYDEEGFRVRMRLIGVDGGLCYSNGYNGMVFTYDDNGYESSRTYVDTNGVPTYCNDRNIMCSKIELMNDEHGNILSFKKLNTMGELMELQEGVYFKCTYDSVGNILSRYDYDADDKIYIPASNGYAGIVYTYNEQGRISRLEYMDAGMKRTKLPNDYYSYNEFEYDFRGNLVKFSHYDIEGKLVEDITGVAMVCHEYDDNGNEQSCYYLNAKGELCIPTNGAARIDYTYDPQGNITSITNKNTNGKPMALNGIAKEERTYDERGNITVQKFFTESGSRVASRPECRMKYDSNDNIVEIAYFDGKGKAVSYSDGFHRKVMQYDSRNNCISEEYYGGNGKLKNLSSENCYAVAKSQYDEKGNRISLVFFTQNGTRGYDKSKVHKYFSQYDPKVNLGSHQLTFGCDGKPVAADGIAPEARADYDKRGNATRITCYDGYGKRVNGNYGWCELRSVYNEAGSQIEVSFYDVENKAVINKMYGYHKCKTLYNDMRLPVEYTYYGIDGKPILIKSGYSKRKIKYNKQNQESESSYYGLGGKKVNTIGGYHREIYTYRNGSQYKCDLFDTSGRKIGSANWVNNKWNYTATSINAIDAFNGDWKQLWKTLADACPADSGNGVVIESVTVGNSEITLYISIDVSAFDVGGSEIKNIVEESRDYLRQQTGTPSYVKIRVVVTDKNGDEIYSIE